MNLRLPKAFFIATFILFFTSITAYSQKQLLGKILKEDSEAIAFAYVGIKGKKAGIISDSTGNFRLELPSFVKEGDSVIISSLGFQALRTTVRQAEKQNEFVLKVVPKELPQVTVNSFSKSNIVGEANGEFTFYRGWDERKTGGEIGRIFNVPHKKYKLETIFFKSDNRSDTCWIRLHIRNIVNERPGEELLAENIILPFSKLQFGDKPSFDLSEYNIILKEKRIFIGFEVMNSVSTTNNTSFCFVGTEYGEYFFKTHSTSPWERGFLHNIDISLFLRH
jgi:hypothetical protein